MIYESILLLNSKHEIRKYESIHVKDIWRTHSLYSKHVIENMTIDNYLDSKQLCWPIS